METIVLNDGSDNIINSNNTNRNGDMKEALGQQSLYKIGERVWVKAAGSPWWPAVIVLADEYGITLPDPLTDVAVKYYAGVLNTENKAEVEEDFDICDVYDDNRILPFEDSSEKAVTTDPALQRAIDMAVADNNALPLRKDFSSFSATINLNHNASLQSALQSKKRVRSLEKGKSAPGGEKSKHDKPEKHRHHSRHDSKSLHSKGNRDGYSAEDADSADDAASTVTSSSSRRNVASGAGSFSQPTTRNDGGKKFLSISQISAIQSRLAEALKREKTSQNSISTVRECLLHLATCQMDYKTLKATKVGVTVAEVLAVESLAPLFPLARAIIGDWLLKLPEETIKAIRYEGSLKMSY